MSLESWKKKFLPDFPERMTTESAVIHNLNKWKGAKPENLKKHGVVYYDHRIRNEGQPYGDYILFAADTCALCVEYYGERQFFDECCHRCPIQIMRGYPCDRTRSWGNDGSVYDRARNKPDLMIKLLEQTLTFVQANPKKFSNI